MRRQIGRVLARRRAVQTYRAGGSVEDVLGLLRTSGFSLLESVSVCRSVARVSLREAAETVTESDVWADERDHFWGTQEGFRLALKATADEYREWPDGRYEAIFDLRKGED
jgi:hypothetical protein